MGLFQVTLGIDYAARDTGRRMCMCVRESDSLSAAIRAEKLADKQLARPGLEYTHAINVRAVTGPAPATMALPIAA